MAQFEDFRTLDAAKIKMHHDAMLAELRDVAGSLDALADQLVTWERQTGTDAARTRMREAMADKVTLLRAQAAHVRGTIAAAEGEPESYCDGRR